MVSFLAYETREAGARREDGDYTSTRKRGKFCGVWARNERLETKMKKYCEDYHLSTICVRSSSTLLRTLVCLKEAWSKMRAKASETMVRKEMRRLEKTRRKSEIEDAAKSLWRCVIRLPLRRSGAGEVA